MRKLFKTVVASALTAAIMLGNALAVSTPIVSPFITDASIVASASGITDTGGGGTGTDGNTPEVKLRSNLKSGKVTQGGTAVVDVSGNKYNKDGGGKYTYTELVKLAETEDATSGTNLSTGYINQTKFGELKSSAKSDFLNDMNNVATATIDTSDGLVTEDTRQEWLAGVQRCPGVGTQLIAALLENTKPDYAKANQIYQPFGGIIGTVMALLAILLMGLLGLVMVTDLAYIGIPWVQAFLAGDDNGGKGKPKFVSWEAYSAVQQAEGSGGGNGQSSGAEKAAVSLYLKKRVLMLVILGICLLYLVQGRIWALISWMLDLMSGFDGV